MDVKVNKDTLVMSTYCVALASSVLAIMTGVPFVGILNDIKYLYVLIIVFAFFQEGVIIVHNRFFIALGLLVIHTCLYGIVFVNPNVITHTNVLFQQLIVGYIIVFFTTLYVYKNNLFLHFLQASYIGLAVPIFWGALSKPNHFVNPIYFVNIFSRYGRFRADFGFGDVNYCGNYCLYTLVLSVFLYFEYKKTNAFSMKKIVMIVVVDLLAICMLLSTASRSAVLSFVLFCGCAFCIEKKDFFVKHIKFILGCIIPLIIIVLAVLLLSGKFSSMWVDSNREGNFTINYPYFIQHGNLLNGMGYIDNSGFLSMQYGYATTAVDVYYLYILYTTGYIGLGIIIFQMIYCLICLVISKRCIQKSLVVALLVMMIFYAVWQVNYMNARYYTGWIHMIIIYYSVLNFGRNKVYYFILKK